MQTEFYNKRLTEYFQSKQDDFAAWKYNKDLSKAHPIIQRWNYMKDETISLFYAKMIIVDCFSLVGGGFNPDENAKDYQETHSTMQSFQDIEIEIFDFWVNKCCEVFKNHGEDIHEFCIKVFNYNY